jgi:hypothetical protein
MKLFTFIWALLVATVAADGHVDFSSTTTTIYVQPIDSRSSPITPLADVQYDPSSLSAEISSFNAPALSPETNLVRIGIYDPVRHAWESSTSVTSVNSFRKDYAPILILSLDARGDVVGVSCKSWKIDAGQTRDFGPKIKVMRMTQGKRPELNRPIVVSNEGLVEGEVPEKTLFQKLVLEQL